MSPSPQTPEAYAAFMTSNTTPQLALSLDTKASMSEAEAVVRECLAAEGFGILTEIDVQATLRAKLEIETEPYRILGACNPKLAHRALSAVPETGLLLPCNAVLRATETGTRVEFINPLAMLQMIEDNEVHGVASEAHEKLQRALSETRKRLPA